MPLTSFLCFMKRHYLYNGRRLHFASQQQHEDTTICYLPFQRKVFILFSDTVCLLHILLLVIEYDDAETNSFTLNYKDLIME
jgi:hypothetical protein